MADMASPGSAAQSPGATSPSRSTTLTISDLQQRTGVPAATLRSWETRLGFPVPARSTGGQRRYRESDVELVRRVVAGRESGLSLPAAVAAVRHGREVGTESLYAHLRAAYPHLDVLAVGDRTMRNLTWAIEDECLTHASHPLVIGCFQTEGDFRRSGARWRELGRAARRAIALSDFVETETDAVPHLIALPADSPMLNEWILVCSDAQLSAVLVAWERPARTVGSPRRFEGLLSMDPEIVRDAAERCLAVARRHGLHEAGEPPLEVPGAVEDPRRLASLLRRFAVYADA